MIKSYYIYIMTSPSGTLYVGMTSDLKRRVYQHKHKLIEGFTQKYDINRLVYFEETSDVKAAISREKQVKQWRRSKKVELIQSINPKWMNLSEGWYD